MTASRFARAARVAALLPRTFGALTAVRARGARGSSVRVVRVLTFTDKKMSVVFL